MTDVKELTEAAARVLVRDLVQQVGDRLPWGALDPLDRGAHEHRALLAEEQADVGREREVIVAAEVPASVDLEALGRLKRQPVVVVGDVELQLEVGFVERTRGPARYAGSSSAEDPRRRFSRPRVARGAPVEVPDCFASMKRQAPSPSRRGCAGECCIYERRRHACREVPRQDHA